MSESTTKRFFSKLKNKFGKKSESTGNLEELNNNTNNNNTGNTSPTISNEIQQKQPVTSPSTPRAVRSNKFNEKLMKRKTVAYDRNQVNAALNEN
ncbi:hypothetical protein ABK040_005238 [Willaertia magna]